MQNTMCKFFAGIFLILALLVSGPAASAQEPAAPAGDKSAEAGYLLTYMAHYLAGLKQYSVAIRTSYDVVQESGQKIEFEEDRKITVVRPDRLRIDTVRSDGEKGHFVFDGKDVTVYSDDSKVFAAAPKPGDLDGAVTYFVKDLQMRLPLALMLLTSLPSELEKRVDSIEFVETSTLFDVPCAHLAVRAEQVDFQIWIPTKGEPLPRRVLITYREEPGEPQFRADFSGWDLTPTVSDALFAFTPPEGFKRIPFLAEMRAMQRGREREGGK